MELTAYRKLRAGVQMNAAPATTDAVRPMVAALRDSLAGTGLFSDVEVDATDNVDAMVIGMCTFPAEMDAERLANWLQQLWRNHLCSGFWEAHAMLVDDDQVEFLGATMGSLNGQYVTLHLIAQRAVVPAQRDGED